MIDFFRQFMNIFEKYENKTSILKPIFFEFQSFSLSHSYSWPYCSLNLMQYFIFFRNLDKKGSLDLRSKFLLMLRIIFDCISRMAFLSAYMYSIKGHLFRYTYIETLVENKTILYFKARCGSNLLLWGFPYFDNFQCDF